MERIYLKPTCREILHKDTGLSGQGKEGHLDLFAYDYDTDENKRRLGSLYLVGNVQMPVGEEESSENDVTYITNLVASLAKREYYASPDLAPKEAFSLALKKVNDVVGEFFANKKIKINIGIFAIAGEQINISKLGKFKIILSREDKNIDILNNVDLFTKERVQEKEFSHVISGKVLEGDKILAYYPGRLVTTRERYLKDYLLKFTSSQFVEKLGQIKEEKPEFSCAALYIDLAKAKEPALAPKPKAVPVPEPKTVPIEPRIQLASEKPAPARVKPIKAPEQPAEEEDFDEPVRQQAEPEVDVPRIIRSEFALGRKQNIIQASLNKMKPFMPRFKNKAVIFVTLLGIILASALVVKSLFIISPADKQTASAVEEARQSLKLAKTKISQNDILGARQVLASSISSLISIPSASDKTDQTKSELLSALDGIDQASEVSPALVELMPESVLKEIAANQSVNQKLQTSEYNILDPIAFDTYEANLYVLTANNILKVSDVDQPGKKQTSAWLTSGTLPEKASHIAVDGSVYVLNDSGLLATYYRGEKKKEISTFLLAGENSTLATTKESKNLYLINKGLNRIYIISKESGSLVKTLRIGSNEPITEAYLDKDGVIYFTTSDNRIWKVQRIGGY